MGTISVFLLLGAGWIIGAVSFAMLLYKIKND